MIKNVILSVVNPLGFQGRGHRPLEPLPGLCPGAIVSFKWPQANRRNSFCLYSSIVLATPLG
jgi:hypothetical protein